MWGNGSTPPPSTVRISLRRNNYRFGWPVRKFVLKEAAQNSRLVWVIEHRQFDFDRVVFADGACFALGYGLRVMSLYPRDDKPIVEVPHYPAKVHVLGVISLFGTVGHLSFAPTWNAATFAQGMAADIVPSGIGFFANDWSLQLDNATSHTSAQAQQDLLDRGVPNILFQPPCSLDMKPIKNV